ncbi:MAG: YlxM family DNA-binding protein [Bacilli bacterium]|jgi:predicted DNA-binding protein YlxM (UPF0122 family)|nr:HTH domain-containing protein [Bacilli bacterium]
MEKVTSLIILYDLYGELLTKKQKDYFVAYYFNNLSLSEISDNFEVSRNAIHKQLKIIEQKLYYYEEKLKLLTKSKKLNEIINSINDKPLKEKLIAIDLI